MWCLIERLGRSGAFSYYDKSESVGNILSMYFVFDGYMSEKVLEKNSKRCSMQDPDFYWNETFELFNRIKWGLGWIAFRKLGELGLKGLEYDFLAGLVPRAVFKKPH
jgi:hypothetical protein